MLIEAVLGIGVLAYSANKSINLDAEAMAKRSRAYTRESEAHSLVNSKKEYADKKLQNFVKKKRAVIETTVPRFMEVYQQIQKVECKISENNQLTFCRDIMENKTLKTMQIVSAKTLTDKQLICEVFFKGIAGSMISDSKRNLSAANSQMSAANVAYSQAKSIAEVYDAIAGRADRLTKLIMKMNALFISSISETERTIEKNGTDPNKYNNFDIGILMTCANIAKAMSDIINVPVLDKNGALYEEAVNMIQEGEAFVEQMNEKINL